MSDKIEEIKENAIDVNYEELGRQELFTIEEVAEILKIEISDITYWCSRLSEYLKIYDINTFKIFSREDIRNLETIKRLNFDEKMSMSQIREYLLEHKTSLVKKENDLANNGVLKLFSNIFNQQNQKVEHLVEQQEANNKLLSSLALLIEQDIKARQDSENRINNMVEYVKERDIELVNVLNQKLEEQREKYEEDKQQGGGIFKKIFGKK